MQKRDSKTRFADRVDAYVKARPRYPQRVIELLQERLDLSARTSVADVGSGTGISAELFLSAGCTVFAVEPNAAMRTAAEKLLGGISRFHSVDGNAEATTLPDHSVDLVVAAQAFHWFDATKFRAESLRILHPLSNALLMWNDRLTDCDAFAVDYEQMLLDHGTDYKSVNHRNITEARIAEFFRGPFEQIRLPNGQKLDWEGLKSRLMSSSYVPAEGDPGQQPMLEALRRIFDLHQSNGEVEMKYETQLFLGPLR
jgi:SAM-dependent methyltransferase